MSSFVEKAYHPKTGKIEDAMFLYDYFGRNRYRYVVRFPSDGSVWSARDVTTVAMHENPTPLPPSPNSHGGER